MATGNHPFWVINQDDSLIVEDGARPVNAWMRASHLSEESNYSIVLYDGHKVIVDLVRKILEMDVSGLGWIANDAFTENFMQGHVIDFRGKLPVYCYGQIADAPNLTPLNIETYGGKTYDDYYEHHDPEIASPLCRKVYNLEVEGNHTYFVGDNGIWAKS